LLDVIGRCAADRDPARLHGFRDFTDQLDLEQAVVERGALDLDVIRQIELSLEVARRDAAIEEIALGLLGLALSFAIAESANPDNRTARV